MTDDLSSALRDFIFIELGRACGVFPREVVFVYDRERATYDLDFYLDCAGHPGAPTEGGE